MQVLAQSCRSACRQLRKLHQGFRRLRRMIQIATANRGETLQIWDDAGAQIGEQFIKCKVRLDLGQKSLDGFKAPQTSLARYVFQRTVNASPAQGRKTQVPGAMSVKYTIIQPRYRYAFPYPHTAHPSHSLGYTGFNRLAVSACQLAGGRRRQAFAAGGLSTP